METQLKEKDATAEKEKEAMAKMMAYEKAAIQAAFDLELKQLCGDEMPQSS